MIMGLGIKSNSSLPGLIPPKNARASFRKGAFGFFGDLSVPVFFTMLLGTVDICNFFYIKYLKKIVIINFL